MSASTSTASLFPLITYPQIQQYHEVTDSLAQRRPSILPVLNSFRILSIATGGGTPFHQVPFREKHPANRTSRATTPRNIRGAAGVSWTRTLSCPRSSLLMSATAIPSATNSMPPRPPGPRGLPWLGTSFMASRDSTKKLSRWAREYGDIVYYHFFDLHFYILFHPQHIEQVLLDKTGNFIKGITSRANPELFGNGLLTSDGDFWRRQRRLSNPAFHRESILRYSEISMEEAAHMLEGWRAGETRNIHNDMMSVTLRIVLRSLFGSELGEGMRVIEPALDAIMLSSSGLHSILAYLGVPTRARSRYLRAVAQLDEVVYS